MGAAGFYTLFFSLARWPLLLRPVFLIHYQPLEAMLRDNGTVDSW